MEQLLRKVVASFESDSGMKVDKLIDFHVPFPDQKDLALELAVRGKQRKAFVRFTEEGKLMDWGWIIPSGNPVC